MKKILRNELLRSARQNARPTVCDIEVRVVAIQSWAASQVYRLAVYLSTRTPPPGYSAFGGAGGGAPGGCSPLRRR
jgi:hypothetical protein